MEIFDFFFFLEMLMNQTLTIRNRCYKTHTYTHRKKHMSHYHVESIYLLS